MDALTALTHAFAEGWSVTALSAANTAGAATKAAASGKTHYITGFSVAVSDAATAAAATAISLKDGTTAIWEEILPVSSAIGAGFSREFPAPIKCTSGAAASINSAAAGASSKIRLNLNGYTI